MLLSISQPEVFEFALAVPLASLSNENLAPEKLTHLTRSWRYGIFSLTLAYVPRSFMFLIAKSDAKCDIRRSRRMLKLVGLDAVAIETNPHVAHRIGENAADVAQLHDLGHRPHPEGISKD